MHLIKENWLGIDGKHNEISYRSNNPSKVLFAPYTPRLQPSDLRVPLRAMSIVFLVLGSLRPRKGGTHREKKENRLSSNRTENLSNWATEKENIDG